MTRLIPTGLKQCGILLFLCIVPPALASWDISDTGQPFDEVEVDVDEGTWISVDVSPDGKTLVFDLLGDLFLVPATGGQATPIRQGPAFDRIPRFSPDGKSIAFVSDGDGYDNIWRIGTDGTDAQQVSHESESWVTLPAWTADGKHIIARRLSVEGYGAPHPFGRHLWLYNPAGGAGRKIVDAPNAANEPNLSRDGRWLYYTQDISPLTFSKKSPDGAELAIVRRDLNTNQSRTLVVGYGGAFTPQISPNGESLAFVRRVATKDVLFVYDIATGKQRPVFDGLSRDIKVHPASDGYYPSYGWFPNNRHLAIWAKGALLKIDTLTGEVDEIPFTARSTHSITKALRFPQNLSQTSFSARAIGLPAASADGNTVVFSAVGHIWRKILAGGVPQRLTAEDEFAYGPTLSPDGRRILHVRLEDEGGSKLQLRSLDGRTVKTVLTFDAIVTQPAFSPDGSKIAFRVYRPSPHFGGHHRRPGIYWMSISDGEPHFVSSHGVEPVFSRSGDRLYFNVDFQGPDRMSVLRSLKLDGTEPREHIKSPTAHHFRLSPDHRWVAFQENFQLYVAPYLETGTAMTISAAGGSAPVKKLGEKSGDHHHWSTADHNAGEARIGWLTGNNYFTLAQADLAQAPQLVPPSQAIDLGLVIESDIPTGIIALKGARLITMNEDELIENGVLLVERNRILAVGTADSVVIPDGAKVYDLVGKTILPGLVDAHAHLASGSLPDDIAPHRYSRFYANLAYGVTTAFDPYAPTEFIFRLAEMVKAGRMVGPRIFSTGAAALGFPRGPLVDTRVASFESASDHVARLKQAGAIAVKSYIQPGRVQRQQLAKAARQQGIMVVPEGEGHIYHDLSMILDGYTTVEHNLPVTLYDDVIQLFSHSNTASTPTLMVLQAERNGMQYFYQSARIWEMEKLRLYTPVAKGFDRAQKPLWAHMRTISAPDENYEIGTRAIARSLKELHDAGVLVNLGSHGEIDGIGAIWELWLINQGGISNHDTLKIGTINGARTLGLDGDIGSLEVGKLADLIVLDADPLKNIEALDTVRYAMVNGRLYDSLRMNEIGNTDRPRGRFYWEVDKHPTIDWDESMIGEIPAGARGNLQD